MADEAELDALIAANEASAEAAWEAIRAAKSNTLPAVPVMRSIVRGLGKPFSSYLANQIVFLDLDAEFQAALAAQGVKVPSEPEVKFEDVLFPDKALAWLGTEARSVRCLVRASNLKKGSGVLVGPSTVLTAWHVVAANRPGMPQEPACDIEVEFADGQKLKAVVADFSFCTDDEYDDRLPASDLDLTGKADVALLRLSEPVGIHLGFARLEPDSKPYPGPTAIAVLQYPNGTYQGVGIGKLRRLRGLTGRWGHNVDTACGSSGGGCFDARLALRGIHQGKASKKVGRLVPVSQFPPAITDAVAKDEVPDSLWSVDGSPGSPLVVGREQLFVAFHAAMKGAPRARGLWVKRTRPRDPSGLGFTYKLVESLVNRARDTRIARITFDGVLQDHPNEIARRLRLAGFDIADPEALSGAAADETEREAVVAGRGRALAAAVDAAARNTGVRLWLYFDHPEVLFGDEPRWAVTAFIDQALRMENLRIAVAGYEGLQIVSTQFQGPFDAEGAGAPGLVVEYLGGFNRNDVVNSIVRASKFLRGDSVSQDLGEHLADQALAGLRAGPDGRYPPWMGGSVNEVLKPVLEGWATGGAVPGDQPPPAGGGQ